MQILGLADSTPKPENRLKALFWPTIRNETDVDNVTRQGFWICLVVSLFALGFGFIQGNRLFIWIEIFEAAFFFLCGIGSRMRDLFAAICAFTVFFLASFETGISVLRILILVLLLANTRGIWLSARWPTDQVEPPPLPLNQTLTDKLVDRMPAVLWPFLKFPFYAIAAIELGLLVLGLVMMFATRIATP